MQCPKCQFENREEAKFCKECGAKLELECPKCGAITTLDSRFCDECGYDFPAHRATSRVEDGRGSVKPRFPSPLIKPDVRSYRIRLTD